MVLDSTAAGLAEFGSADKKPAIWPQFEATLSFFGDRGWLDETAVSRYRASRETFTLSEEDFRADVRPLVAKAYPIWKASVRSLPEPFSPGECYLAWKRVLAAEEARPCTTP